MHALDLQDTHHTVEAVQAGLPVSLLADLRDHLGLPLAELAHVLLVSERTLGRHLQRGQPLPVDLSDRLAELLHLLAHAEDVLGAEAAVRWLTTEHPEMATTPLRYSRTTAGRRFVHEVLVAVQHGFVV